MELKDTLKADLANYEKQIQEKKQKISELNVEIRKLEAEVNLFNGAMQQCVKLLNAMEPSEVVDGAEPKAD
jgi:chromosome segregation ATPase